MSMGPDPHLGAGPGAAEIEALQRGIDALADVDLDALEGPALGQLAEAIEVAHRRLDLVRHRTAGRYISRGCHRGDGFLYPAQWGAARLGLDKTPVNRMVRVGKLIGALPTLEKRWEGGEISSDHVAGVLRARRPAVAETFDDSEDWFAGHAAKLKPSGCRKLAREWLLHNDPDGEDQRAKAIERDRDAKASVTFEGAVAFRGHLPALGGQMLKDVFDDICDELHAADRAEATQRLGRDPKPDELRRTPAQRRADAFIEMATRARAHMNCTKPHAEPKPLLVILAGLDAVTDGLARTLDGQPITPGQLAELLASEPNVQRFVYGPDERPIRYNPRHRLFTGKLREAILARDPICKGSGCDHRSKQVDHRKPFSQGGLTVPENARGACGPCNGDRPNRRFDDDPPPGPDPP